MTIFYYEYKKIYLENREFTPASKLEKFLNFQELFLLLTLQNPTNSQNCISETVG